MATKYLKGFCALWAAGIYGASFLEITRDTWIRTPSVAVRTNPALATKAWEYVWWFCIRGFHVAQFAILSLLLIYAFDYLRKRPLAGGLIALAYSILLELYQPFLVRSGGPVSSILIDALGIGLAIVIFVRLEIKKDKHSYA